MYNYIHIYYYMKTMENMRKLKFRNHVNIKTINPN